MIEGIWAALIEECRELDGVDWEWQSVDCSMGKARFGGAPLDAIPRTVGRLGARKASWSTGPKLMSTTRNSSGRRWSA